MHLLVKDDAAFGSVFRTELVVVRLWLEAGGFCSKALGVGSLVEGAIGSEEPSFCGSRLWRRSRWSRLKGRRAAAHWKEDRCTHVVLGGCPFLFSVSPCAV